MADIEMTNVEMRDVLQDKALTLFRQARELVEAASRLHPDFRPAAEAWLGEYDDLLRLSGSNVTKAPS